MAGGIVGAASLHGIGHHLAQPTEVAQASFPTEGLPRKGASADRAAVTMVECSDFQCPFSKRASHTVDLLLERNEDVAFYHAHLPLGAFEHSELKARAAVAAQRQQGFWVMHDALYTADIRSQDDAIELAARLGLDDERFEQDLSDPASKAEVQRQRNLCVQAGVRGVPTFFINGTRVVGAIPADQLQRVIDQERR